MSVQNISTGIQSTEQYKIHKQNEKISQDIKEIKQVDEYDKDNPAGEEIEGVYSVSHDEEGNLKVNYKQPASNSKTQEAHATQSTQENSNDDEEEIEKLKQQRDAIKQHLNREKDENIKATLRAQLQSIEMQIALKSSGNTN